MTGRRASWGWAALLAVWLAGPAAASGDPAHGLWLTGNGSGIVDIGPCGDLTCGRMVWLRRPADATGAPRRDEENPDIGLRARPLCGLPLLEGFVREAPGRWTGGRIYNPRDGRHYSAELTADGPDRLRVRGYVGLPVLGRSQDWTRVPDDRGGC